MKNEALKTIEYKGYTVNVFADDNGYDPREWDNLGTMLCMHGRYQLGDKHSFKSSDFDGWGEVKKYLTEEEKAVIVLPLYLYDHSGLRMKVGSFAGLLPQGHAEFDSGCVGFIYVTRDKLLSEYSAKKVTKKILDQAEAVLRAEVKTYDQYLSGDVYGYTVTDSKGEQTDSCWGYYGYDENKSGLLEAAQDVIDHTIITRIKSRIARLKALIKGKVELKKMKKATKQQLAQWHVESHSDCGFNNHHGYKMSDEDFFKEQMKKSKNELINDINNHSDDGQEFLKNNGYAE